VSAKLAARRPVKDALERSVPHKRDAAATRQRILQAACKAFAVEGFTGARIDQIAKAAEANVQMIYRYFGGKEDLYLAALEATYAGVRSLERELDLGALEPAAGMRRLVEFTFDYLRDNPEFVAIVRNENVIGGRFVRQLPMVSDTTYPLVEAISDLLRRGCEAGVFKAKTDAMNLYVTILSLCITHLAQKDTLSVMFGLDLSDKEWLKERREQVICVVLSFLTAPYGAGIK
jgi:AcrR family transcriptional regulator